MYVPAAFAEDRVPVIHDAIRAAGLATLVTSGPDGPIASPLPLMLDPEPAPYGTLHGHLARANPQWRDSDPHKSALAIFNGPDAYITPAWYATKRATGKVVPTWNYVTIQASGPITFFTDPDELHALVSRLTDLHETRRAATGQTPWAVTDAPETFIRSQLSAIVGFRLHITCLEGKWKMSQNRPPADREGVIEGLTADANIVAETVAERAKETP